MFLLPLPMRERGLKWFLKSTEVRNEREKFAKVSKVA